MHVIGSSLSLYIMALLPSILTLCVYVETVDLVVTWDGSSVTVSWTDRLSRQWVFLSTTKSPWAHKLAALL